MRTGVPSSSAVGTASAASCASRTAYFARRTSTSVALSLAMKSRRRERARMRSIGFSIDPPAAPTAARSTKKTESCSPASRVCRSAERR